ncbi:MAG TPA: DUF2341 domain-containing protein [Chitinivibrionales bacterium]|nr:DUF2341 domain-containing protein [Chitinivibrionales bacterium]
MDRALCKAFSSVLALLTGAGACFFLHCAVNLAGSVTEGGNVEIAGLIVDSLGNPAAGALVSVRPRNYVKDTGIAVLQRSVAVDVVTESNGRFRIDSIEAGDYCLSATKGESLAVMARFGVPPADTFRDTLVLGRAAQISGIVVNQSALSVPIYVQVVGLDRIAKVDSASGAYQIPLVPAGDYRLQVVASSSDFVPLVVPDVNCQQGQNTLVDTIAIAPFSSENYGLWPNAKVITLNTTAAGANVAGTVTNFPVMVHMTAPTFTFNQFLSDGHDIRFANSKGRHLPYEIERFDPYAGIADVWVLVDTVKGNDSTAITVYWGNLNAAAQSLASVVFDTALGYQAVWHLNQRALNERLDATDNGYNAQPEGYEGDEWTYGLIGGCDSVDDNDDHLMAPSINAASALTLSMWVNSYEWNPSSNREFCIAKAGSATGKPPLYSLMINENRQLDMTVTTNGKPDSVGGGSLTLNNWYFIAGIYDGNAIDVYINGALVASKNVSGAIDTSGSNTTIAYFDKISQKLHGKIDEVRIMKLAASADWIKLNYENQRPGSTFVRFAN